MVMTLAKRGKAAFPTRPQVGIGCRWLRGDDLEVLSRELGVRPGFPKGQTNSSPRDDRS